LPDWAVILLMRLAKGSLRTLHILTDRINAVLSRIGSPYRLYVPVADQNKPPGTTFYAGVIVRKNGVDGPEVTIGKVTQDDDEVG
jgi:hypothetical protein